MGTGVIGGMIVATAIAVFFIPMFYYLLETMSSRSSGNKQSPGQGTLGTGSGPTTTEAGPPAGAPSQESQ